MFANFETSKFILVQLKLCGGNLITFACKTRCTAGNRALHKLATFSGKPLIAKQGHKKAQILERNRGGKERYKDRKKKKQKKEEGEIDTG